MFYIRMKLLNDDSVIQIRLTMLGWLLSKNIFYLITTLYFQIFYKHDKFAII